MPKKKDVDWNAVQRDRDEAMPVKEIEKKYGVSNPTIYAHTHSTNGKGHKVAGGGERCSAALRLAVRTATVQCSRTSSRSARSSIARSRQSGNW